jgi:hypothetical protein
MGWDAEILKRTADRYVLLEMVLDDQTLHFGNRELAEDDAYWEPWILGMGQLQQALDPETRRVSFSDLSLTLKNPADQETGIGFFSALLEGDTVLDGRTANIYLAFKDAAGTVSREKIFSGLMLPGETDQKTFEMSLHVPLEDRLTLLQRHATETAFDSTLPAPVPMNAVLGTVTGASRGGPVKCIPLDLTANAERFLVAQHAVASIGNVYRLRAGAWSTVSAGLTKVTKTLDAEGRYYAALEFSSGHSDGDEYFAEVTGLTRDEANYVTFNGTTQTFSATPANSPHVPGRTGHAGAFSVEFMIQRGRTATLEVFGSVFNATGDQRAWQVLANTSNQLQFVISSTGATGAGQMILTMTTTLLSSTAAPYIVRVGFPANASVTPSVWINGVAQATSLSGALQASVFVSTANFYFGRNEAGNYFQGRGYYFISADGLHALAAGTTGHFDGSPLPNPTMLLPISGDAVDLTGNNTLTVNNAPAFTTAVEANPAYALKALLMSAEGWGLTSAEIDCASFDTAAAWCTAQGLDAAGVWGGAIPERGGDLESADLQWELLALIARNFDHAVVPNRSGQISLKQVPTELVDPTGLVHYRQSDGDVIGPLLVIRQRPIALVNDARAIFKHAHSAEALYDKYLRAYNATSQEFYGLTKEVQWPYRFHRDLTVLQAVLGPQVQLRSGKTREVSMTTPGLWGLQDGSGVGDVVLLSAAAVFGTFSERQILITSASADLLAGTVTLKGLTLGDSVGTVAFSTEETAEVEAALTTFVGATQNPNPDDFEDADAGAAYGAAGYLRLGHHYQILPVDRLNINWRALGRITLPAATWSGRTIKAVTIQVQVMSVPSLLYSVHMEQYPPPPAPPEEWDEVYDYRSNFTGGTLNRFMDETWDGADTFNSLGGLGGYSADVGTQLGSFSGGTGVKNIILDATGKALFVSAAAGSGEGGDGEDVNLCLGDFSSGDFTNAAILSKVIKAIITYQTS